MKLSNDNDRVEWKKGCMIAVTLVGTSRASGISVCVHVDV
jgi:hypothetical protein